MTVPSEDSVTIRNAISENIETGSTLYTDDHRGYMGAGGDSYEHKTVNHSAKEYVNGMAHTNGVESVWAIIKRDFNGVYHHWSKKHCQQYINEFTFRLDDLFKAMTGKTITYKDLTA